MLVTAANRGCSGGDTAPANVRDRRTVERPGPRVRGAAPGPEDRVNAVTEVCLSVIRCLNSATVSLTVAEQRKGTALTDSPLAGADGLSQVSTGDSAATDRIGDDEIDLRESLGS